MRRKRARVFSVLILIVGCGATIVPDSAHGDELVIVGASIIDPTLSGTQGPVTIVVDGGIFRSIGPAESVRVPESARVIDATGRYALPGIADMHNHLYTGTFQPGDDQLGVLRSLLDWGVTATFDPGIRAEKYEALRGAIREEPLAYPRTFLVKGVFTTDGGWGRGYAPATTDEARAIVRELKAVGSDGVKLMYDDMRWATTRPFPIMDRAVMTAIIDEAHLQGMMAFAHAPILELAKEVLEGGVDCLIHGILSDPIDSEFIELMHKNESCYISTLTMFQTNAGLKAWADRLDEFDTEDRLDPETLALFRKTPVGTPRLDNTGWAVERLPVLKANLLAVHRAGISVVLGTDTGIPGVLPGIAAQLEMAMHVEAGLTAEQTLQAATVNAARMMGQADVFGRIAEGMQADMLILDADPREDISNIRRIRHVIRGGRVVK